jgi:hypothetical protein
MNYKTINYLKKQHIHDTEWMNEWASEQMNGANNWTNEVRALQE